MCIRDREYPFLCALIRVYAIHSEKNVPSAGTSQKASNEYPCLLYTSGKPVLEIKGISPEKEPEA